MANEKKPTKGSHFLPRAYLKNFLLNDELVMYKKGQKFFDEKTQPADRILTVQGEDGLNNVAKQNKLYFCENIEGMSPDFMEDFFRERIEGKITPLLEEVRNLSLGDIIPDEIRELISLLMASTMLRVPKHKALIEELYLSFLQAHFELVELSSEEKEMMKANYKEATGKDVGDEFVNEAMERFLKGEFKIKISPELFVKTILNTLEYYSNIFYGMKMAILKSDGKNLFFTTDNPVAYFVPNDKVDFYNAQLSLMSQYTEAYFPLSKDFCVLMHRNEPPGILLPCSEDVYKGIENTLSCFSQDFIFSPLRNETLDDFAKEYIPYPFKLVRK